MSFRTVVFPGQGAQRDGMVRDVCAAMPEARALFTEASMTLGLDVGALCWEGDSRLGLTAFTQPCLLTAELALYRALQARVGLSPEHFGGHSLGEYAALVAAGAIPFSSALRLVQRRGALMQSACPHGFGAMVAVIGDALPRDAVGTIATAHGLDIANDNSPAQLVLSGPGGAVEAACAALAADSVTSRLRVVRLAVSAPFHSRHMAPIEAAYAAALEEEAAHFTPAAARAVVSNYTGEFHSGALRDLLTALTQQLSGRVRWQENMATLLRTPGDILELGPDRPLSAFFQAAGRRITAVIDLRSMDRAFPGRITATGTPRPRPVTGSPEGSHATL